MAWTAASEELKVGSEQEVSSFVPEPAANLRLLFNSFSSRDIFESYNSWGEFKLKTDAD